MTDDFVLPSGLTGKFAVVKLWAGVKTAEDECIARIKAAAKMVGLECFEIYADGQIVENKSQYISKDVADFVLHLHYDTPKMYDVFSFVALWNPLKFYSTWGYARTSRNLLTHDDFLSCSSVGADDHLLRLIRNKHTHLAPRFNLYHSVAEVVHSPSLGCFKLFYAGINWDALNGGASRHQELLKRLDKTEYLCIFGPRRFQGVNVWNGYKSYVKEIPFDGISMIDEISKAGIALVLSSQAHKESQLMSNRLFESVAAGALVICDENGFANRFFGDSLLYIDTRLPIDEVFYSIEKHISWIKANPNDALNMIIKAQEIFSERFSLTQSLKDIYLGLKERKQKLLTNIITSSNELPSFKLFLLMPEFSESQLDAHIKNIATQEYINFQSVLVVDKISYLHNEVYIKEKLATLQSLVEILEVDFYEYGFSNNIKIKRKLGAVIYEVLSRDINSDAIAFVAPNERIYSNHLQVLAGSLTKNPKSTCVATAVIVKRSKQAEGIVSDIVEFNRLSVSLPVGFARFAFRVNALPSDLNIALPYIDRKVMALLVGDSEVEPILYSTVEVYTDCQFLLGDWDEVQENELISTYCPRALLPKTGHQLNISYPDSSQPIVSLGIKRFSLNWFLFQISAFVRQGFSSRMSHIIGRLKSDTFQ